MPPAQQGGQGTDENATIWLAALTIVALVGIWFLAHQWISFFFLKLKLLELQLITPFTHRYANLHSWLQQLSFENAADLNLVVLGNIGNQVGTILRYPFAGLLLLCALWLFFGDILAQYRHTYTMNRLAETEQREWPQITPIVPLNLIDVPLDEGPWAMAMNPMHFAKKYKLLSIEKQLPTEEQLSNAIKHKVTIKRLQAKQVFLMQLGNYWHGVDHLPMHFRALFAMFAAKAHGDATSVISLNNQIAVSASKTNWKNINFNGVDELLKKYFKEKDVQKVITRHAFVYTVMAAMLELARQSGVYASADFLWLKPLDRRLWYILNNVGRKTAFSEVGGIFAHLNAEMMYQRPIYVPMIDEAIDALEIALTEILYKSDGD